MEISIIKFASSTDKSIMPSTSKLTHIQMTLLPFALKLAVHVYKGAVLPELQFAFPNVFSYLL